MHHHRPRRLGALLATLLLLAGLPWLATTLTWPDLDTSLTTWEVYLRSGRLPTGVGTAVLITALWTVWGLYLVVLGAEIAALLRRRPLSLGPLRPLQLLAATTLGAMTVTPTVAYATPVAEASNEDEDTTGGEHEQIEEDPAEPFVVDRTSTVDDFGYDSADLTKDMAEDIDTTARLIADHGASELPIVVTGHTDAAGDPTYNRDLSERRAKAVAAALRTHLGEDVVVEVRGAGVTALLDSEDDAAQRRVEISYGVVVTPPPADPPQDGSGTEEEPADEQATPAVGLSLPGGLILAMAAVGAGTMAGMALERRNGHPPVVESPTVDEDAEEHDEHTRTEGVPPPASSETDEDKPTKPGPEMALIDLARGPGLGITGPGADGAARTLLQRALDEDESELTVVVPDEDLRSLLASGRRPPLLSEDAPVMVTETVDDALTLLQLQVLARHRAADEALEHEDGQAQNTDPGPQFVLLTRADPVVAEEVTSLLAHTHGAPLSAVLLGPWPHPDGPTLTLDPTGTITAVEEPLIDLRGHRWATTPADDLERALQNHRETPGPTPELEEEKTSGAAHGQDEHRAPTSTPSKDTAHEPSPGAVAVTVLGPVTLSVHGKQVRPARKPAYEVLAYLAAHPAGARLEAAVDAMWPEETPHRAIRRFHDACTSVRSACRPDLGEAATGVIIHEGEVYRLNTRMVSCDLWRMDDLLDQAGQADDGAVLATSAAAMLDGDFAEQTDYRWAEAIRARIRNRIVESLTDHSREFDEWRAISMLRRALKIDPMAGEVAIELARRYEQKGDKEAARRILKGHEKTLEGAE